MHDALPIPPDTQHYLLRMQAFGTINGGSYRFPQDLFRSTLM